ncbi:LysR family transcriptional regulator [Belnapia sp. T6]|uniref:LysR family transcriptional regulator n=1 Tax=Belnapia mucosa TaxID=2804532 RepID=A0ABS1VA10_9PROT|nr:LysR family transcriptional regulator [Belnapia mucosa]MBL6458506.1 LysR family transcriptional regulator [Belnapia mucosa]
MDRLEELRLFAAVVEAGSLAAAGRRLGHSPPAVTRAVAALEARLGTRLLERSTRRLAPTEAGRQLAEQGRRLLSDYAEAMATAAGEAGPPRGRLRIGAPLVFGRRHVAPVLADFLVGHPAVTAELLLSDRNADLLEEGIDVALRIGPLSEGSLVARRIGQLRRMVAASPGWIADHGRPAAPEALAGQPAVIFGTAPGAMEWSFQAPGGGGTVTVRPAPRLAVNEAEAAVEAAIAGHGPVRALSYQLAEALADGRLVRLLEDWEGAPIPVSLVLPSARLMPSRIRAFLDFAAPRLAALPVLRLSPAAPAPGR